MKHPRYYQYFFAAALCAGSGQVAGAADLGDIHVTSGYEEASVAGAVNSVTVIDRDTIRKSRASSVVELLKGVAGIVVSDTSGIGAKARVDLGGYGETAAANSVVLVDGRRVNSPDLSGTDWTQIPPDQIERIEIVHGGGSVLYGDGAVGGVVNIITRIPESGGEVSVSGGSFGSRSGAVRVGAGAGDLRAEANLSTDRTDGYRENSLFERFDAGARIEADLGDSMSLRLAGNYHRDRSGLPGSLTTAQVAQDRRQSTRPNDHAQTSDSFLDAGINWAGESGLELDLSGTIRDRQTHADFVSFGSNSDIVIRTGSLRPKVSYRHRGAIPFRLLAGADLDTSRGSFTYGGAFPLPVTSVRRERGGFYGQASLGDEQSGWRLEGGLRSESVKDTFTQAAASSVSQRKSLWSLGTNVALGELFRLRLSASSSVRFPLLDERYSFFSGVVNTNLKPQTGRHYGAALRYGHSSDWVELSFTRADLVDEIYYDPMLFANSNYTDNTRHDVLMLTARWDGGELLKLDGNITRTTATFRGGAYSGKMIPAVPSLRVGFGWEAEWSGAFRSLLQVTHVSDAYLISDQANIRTKLPAYTLLDLVLNYRIGDLDMFARVDNLANAKYSSYGVYSSFSGTDNFYPAAGTAVRAGVSYRF